MSAYTIVHAAEVTDYTGGAPGAFLMFSVRVEDHRTESLGHEGFWPDG